ncbi:MAG: hypothetical protein DRN96_02600 [Thermoproteota archaeon]|nr:MAG: hypothetical protein DRN96_02600 [Candidatus Korarchaeota archaeon]RLG55311.1 MAG: hypothetical protein DRN99_03005 [Candidatus Korarchaeota archaeon]
MKVVVERVVKSPVQRVFWFTADGENAPKWIESIYEARRVAGQLGKGSRVYYRAEVAGSEFEFITEAIEWEPLRRFRDIMVEKLRGPLREYSLEGLYEQLSPRKTRVKLILEFQLDMPQPAKAILEKLIAYKLRRSLMDSLRKLDRL